MHSHCIISISKLNYWALLLAVNFAIIPTAILMIYWHHNLSISEMAALISCTIIGMAGMAWQRFRWAVEPKRLYIAYVAALMFSFSAFGVVTVLAGVLAPWLIILFIFLFVIGVTVSAYGLGVH